MSVPMVSGVAGLMASIDPSLSGKDFLSIIRLAGVQISPGVYRLSASKAVKAMGNRR